MNEPRVSVGIVEERRLVEGHGDLRPEHVYLRDLPDIIDCLEFRADLRQLDPINEISYLALECRRLGGARIEDHLLRRYRDRTGDVPPRELVRFYEALNALIRARIAIRHLTEPGTRTTREWTARAAGYLAIATRATRLLAPRRARRSSGEPDRPSPDRGQALNPA